MVIKFVEPARPVPNGKLADVEVHFTDSELVGLKLIGFGLWERRATPDPVTGTPAKDRVNVTFPARTYSVNGDRRTFALLRPVDHAGGHASQYLIGQIIEAWEQHLKEVEADRISLAITVANLKKEGAAKK